jgi:cytidyltransferase-like protein
MRTIVLVTGGFDPLHSGHIAYFKSAKSLGDELMVGLNSDAWLVRKKGRAFMPFEERIEIVKNLFMVDAVMDFDDTDGSAAGAIFKAKQIYGNNVRIVFANGGDRTNQNIPELVMYGDDPQIDFVFGVGGEDKKNSSSWILEEWKSPKTERQWGYYRVLHENGNEVKVKELTVDPGKRLSMQRHKERSEHWFVAEGVATVYTIDKGSTDYELHGVYPKHKYLHINREEWHMLANETEHPLKVVEIQYGTNCVEEDIERK